MKPLSAIDKIKLKEQLAQLSVEELRYILYKATWRKATKDRPGQRWWGKGALVSSTPFSSPADRVNKWNTWLILAGRGWGKTRTGAQWLCETALDNPNLILAVVAPTHDLLLKVCIEGESGILSRLPKELIADYVKSPSPLITLKNGSVIQGYSAQDPERLRGPQFHGVWCDELGAWDYPKMALDMVKMCNRLGEHPQLVITTTPKPLKIFRTIMNGDFVKVTRGSTFENRDNLAKTFFQELVQFEGTQIGRQELYGELLDMEESGIFKRSWIKTWASKEDQPERKWKDRTKRPFPKIHYVVQSYDTAFTKDTMNDPTACSVWGLFRPYPDKAIWGVMLLDAWRDWLSYPELRKKVVDDFDVTYGPDAKGVDLVLLEEKGSGISLNQDLQRAHIPVQTYIPDEDKIARAHARSPYVKQGFLWIPESSKVEGAFAKWAQPFIEELCSFGPATYAAMVKQKRKQGEMLLADKGAKKAKDGTEQTVDEHDDWVDTTTQMLAWLVDSGILVMKEDERDEDDMEPVKVQNPYGR